MMLMRSASLTAAPPSGRDQVASTSFSRTAYMAASMRLRSCSFSRMLRTWFLTVFSAMTSSVAMSLFDRPARHEAEHLELAVAEAGGVAVLLLDPARQRVELAEQPRRHRRRDQAVAARDRAHRFG